MRKLEAIRKAGANVQEIALAPLAPRRCGGSSLRMRFAASRSAPRRWRELVHEKTAGNPFFAIQFLSALAEEGLLAFDHDAARWSWDLERIHAKGYTDNVVDLMVGKLTPPAGETQEALQQLACLGNSAEIAMLAIVRGTSEEAGPRGALGGRASGVGRAPGRRLPVPPRPRPGGGLFAHPRRRARRRRICGSAGCSRRTRRRRSARRRSSRSSISSTAAPR